MCSVNKCTAKTPDVVVSVSDMSCTFDLRLEEATVKSGGCLCLSLAVSVILILMLRRMARGKKIMCSDLKDMNKFSALNNDVKMFLITIFLT